MMNVSSWSIRNPIAALMVFVLLTVVGLMGYRSMKIQQFPDIDLPTINITASLPGAAPAQMETEVARKIENAVASLQGIKNIYSNIQDGVALITVEFRLEKPTQDALDDVRSAVARIRSDLPGALRDPVIAKMDLAGAPILTYTVSSPRMDEEALSWFVDNDVTKALLAVRGVGAINRVGGASREVRVALDPARMLALGVTAATLSRQLQSVQQDASGGRSDIGGSEQSVRTIATVRSAQELAQMQIALPDGRHVRLADVADVSDTVAQRRSGALLGNKPVVAVEVVRAKGASETEVADGVRAALDKLKVEHPDVAVSEAFNFVDPVVENFNGSMGLMLEGAALAVIVVFLFLRDWRATLVAATALPLSIIPTFAIMYYVMGFTLNLVTLLSLSLVVGVLVDDAIVEIENIMRHLRMGKTPYQAAMEAADEIGLAVIATTFTLIAVFLPTAFMAGIAGKFFVQFGWTAAIAVFFSLVVARMLTPMMAAYILKPPTREYHQPRWLTHYTRLANWCLHNRVMTLLVTVVFFVGCMLLAGRLNTGFMPPDDLSQTQITLTLPPGSTYAQTAHSAAQALTLVRDHPQLKSVYTAIGGGTTGTDTFNPSAAMSDVTKATLTLNMTHRSERPGLTKQDIESDLRQRLQALPGARVKVGFGQSSEKYVLVLAGDDGQRLATHAAQVERELRGIPGIGAVTSSAALVRPELRVTPDLARAADLGVTSAAIADTLRVATSGDYEQALAKLNLSQRQVPIMVRLPEQARGDLGLIKRLPVPSTHGGNVPLESVATLQMSSGPSVISRLNRVRNVNFEIELNGQPLGAVKAAALALPSVMQLPPGITQTEIGDAEAMTELMDSFGLAMLTGVMCIYIVLVLLFKSFIQPVTILGALVLSVPGAFLALWVTGTDLSMPSMIGMIMLMGIATKNSILLVDYIVLAQREHGLGRWEAVLDACGKRARPIVMTTIAMAAGMLPIALGIGVDPSFRSPMAIVVIGGLITSTFLSLLVIPALYTIVDGLMIWVRRCLGMGQRHASPAGDGATAAA